MIRCLALCLTLLPGLAMARPAHHPPEPPAPVVPLTPPAMCEAAIAGAEAEAKLPARVLTAIALRESGRIDPDTGTILLGRQLPYSNPVPPIRFYRKRYNRQSILFRLHFFHQ